VATTTTNTVVEPPVREVAAEPRADPQAPSADVAPPDGTQGVAIAAAGGMAYAAEAGGEPLGTAYEGLVFGVEERDGDWLGLRDQCDHRIWAPVDQVQFTPRNTAGTPSAMSFDQAVLVIDPGHGGANLGATGPTGLQEPVVNLDIARRIRDLLERSNTVNWGSGLVTPGPDIPPAGRVWVTRVEGPPGADVDSGLTYRATLATMAGAHALVSVHNNADPDGLFAGPGSEAFYQIADPESRRLAGLVVEEFRRGFTSFDVAWVGDTDAGAKYRLRSDGTSDYYGLLRGAGIPSVIAEGAFISSPAEEALLRTAEFRQAYADAVYRALVRFITTADAGSGFTEPYPRTVPAGSGAPAGTCRVAAQP
jgi:N-acetylmuramoyl-L-alanine amidase